MIKNQDIICISSIDWDFIWQGHQEIMSTFAKNGNRVLFVENTGVRAPNIKDLHRLRKRFMTWLKSYRGFRQVQNNLYVYSPLILPFPYSLFIRKINKILMHIPLRRWMKVVNFNKPIIWSFLPTGTALDIIESVNPKLVVYYLIADFEQIVKRVNILKSFEKKMFQCSDIIFVQGKHFYDRAKQWNDNVYIAPFGANISLFQRTHLTLAPVEIQKLPRPILGYIGGIHKHIDFDLLTALAKHFHQGSIVLIGPAQTNIDGLKSYSNVHLLGQKAFDALSSYVKHFDVGLVPYVLNTYTQTVNPTKINEYHALGIPVISTNLPEIQSFGYKDLIYVSNSTDEFIKNVEYAIKMNDKNKIQKRIEAAKSNDWRMITDRMSNKMEEILDKKNVDISSHWFEKFSELYRRSRKKVGRMLSIFLILMGFIFYTPLVWYFASPLKINSTLKKSDTILVLLGGMGENGKAGQSSEERVAYATQLFKNGFASTMIFSSGSRGSYFETHIMKALAVSLGIPPEAILVEDKASSTYQNILFSNQLIDEKKWHRIILVSSPYHMRRASLVFQKVASDKEVIYAPVPKNNFYLHGGRDERGHRIWRQLDGRQLKGILHEYAAMIYYWWKEYI